MDLRLFILASVTSAAAAASSLASDCSAVSLPAGGVLDIAGRGTITLTQAAVFTPECTQSSLPVAVANTGILEVQEKASDSTSAFEVRDPFYASTFPQCYALAATTVIAYTLVIMLLITPRSFLDGGVVVLGRGGFTSGGTGGQNIGGRPWLQKMAATFVAVSMTIATVDTFRVAEQQYAGGYQNASVMQADVLGSTELKVIKIISEAFLWLAQAQTLIRLFPRQREKIIIKWTAFALIAFGVLFDSLNSFMYTTAGATRPRSFTDAIPALSYLFQLSLGVLYAAWVVYYSFMKKHYAYYHPQMRNIGLVALLSVTAVLVPIVFFILDICKPDFTSWGDYVRWVGGAAASTIVWEWVERIEALEREEKKDGILGREVFDGDEMLGMSVSEYSWPRKRRNTKRDDDDDDGGESGHATRARAAPTSSDGKSGPWPLVSSIASRYRQRSRSRPRDDGAGAEAGTRGAARGDRGERSGTIRFLQPPLWPTRPPPAATPVSRTDTASAASTVYAVHYQPMADTTTGAAPDARPDSTIGALPAAVPEVDEPLAPQSRRNSAEDRTDAVVDRALAITPEPSVTPSQSASQVAAGQAAGQTAAHTTNTSTQSGSRLRGLSQATQLFRMPSRGNMTSTEASHKASEPSSQDSSGRRNFKSRFEDFAVTRAERLRERMRPEVDTKALPVRVIPAPPRRGAALQQLRQEQAAEQYQQQQVNGAMTPNPSLRHAQAPSVNINNNNNTTTARAAAAVGSTFVSPRLWRSNSQASDNTPIASSSQNSSGANSLEMTNLARPMPVSGLESETAPARSIQGPTSSARPPPI